MTEPEPYTDEEWDALSAEEQNEAIVVDSFRKIEQLGLDPNQVDHAVGQLVEAGVDPVSALDGVVSSYDHSEAADELSALEKISAREGWS